MTRRIPLTMLGLQCLCLAVAGALAFHFVSSGAPGNAAGAAGAVPDLEQMLLFAGITLLLWAGTAGRVRVFVAALVVLIATLHALGAPGSAPQVSDFLLDVTAGTATGLLMFIYARNALHSR
jgi:hypothetical protein